MKKIIAVIAALVVTGSALFAGDFYNGDIQFQGGLAVNTTKISDFSDDIKAKEFDLGLQSWHLFRPISLVGVGFMAGLNAGVGTTEQLSLNMGIGSVKGNMTGLSYSVNAEFGPAVAIYLANIIRIAGNFSYNAGTNFDMPFVYENTVYNYRSSAEISTKGSYKGFSAGLQAKLFPAAKCSLLVGWKLVKGLSDSYEYQYLGSSGSETSIIHNRYDFTQNHLYAGLSVNW